MGLAASQAKLLSLTCRISDNELRAQSLTAAKMALANQTSEASREYLKALNTNEFVYRTYDDNGDKVYTKLTGAQLSTYAPLKNQYALINPQGQVLVSELDAANYEDSANINEFLAKYGVEAIDTGQTRTVKNPAYDVAYEKWKKEYDEWMSRKEEPQIKVIDEPDTYEYVQSTKNGVLYDAFIKDICGCINCTMRDEDNCWCHVLVKWLGQNTHTTSTGETYQTVLSGASWNGIASYEYPNADKIIEAMKESYCSGDVIPGGKEEVSTPYTKAFQENWTTYERDCMFPDVDVFTITVGGPPSDKNMTVYQRCVDLLYLGKTYYNECGYDPRHGGPARSEILEQFYYFIEHDLKSMFSETKEICHPGKWHNEDNPNYEKWKNEEPKMEDIEATIEEKIYEYSDKDKAQWYVNLWHRMNGASDDKDGTETTTKTTTYTEVTSRGTSTTTKTNTTTRNRWDILEDGLMNSQDWLKYALESGAVTLERVNFADPTEEGTGIRKAQWTSIIYSNALDISEQTNEAAIARAEAKYQQKTREIENKDKQYDSMLKLLDTEHNALQQEYETTKTVISKNTERTIKIYQA